MARLMEIKMIQKFLAVGILLAGLLPVLNADELEQSVKPTNVTATVVADIAEPNIIEYRDTALPVALRALASKAGVSLILDESVTGNVTVHLEDIGYTNALKLIAESKGFAYVEDRNYKNLVKIQSKGAQAAEPAEVRVAVLRYSKAEDLSKVLTPLLTAQGKILVDPRVNTLILSDVPSNVAKLQTMIEALDTQTPQVQIEAKFVEHTRNPKKDLGVNWSTALLDHTLGTANGSSSFNFSKSLAGGPWTMPTMILDAGQAQVTFSFLSQDGDTELLANPRIVTANNSAARIAILEKIPIPSYQYNQTTGQLQINGLDTKEIGITLTVTPRINSDDFITMEVSTNAASSQNGSVPINSVNIPIVDTREAQTTVLIKSGHTLAIGGMMRQDVKDNYTKVPLLGSIPGLGVLFRSRSLSTLKRDLYIFLTPTIIRLADQIPANKAVTNPPFEPVYTNDRWMPHDTARPSNLPIKNFGGK